MEYRDEILCFIGAVVIDITPVPQEEHFYDVIRGPLTHSKVNKYPESYTEDGIIGVCSRSGIMELAILPLIFTGERKTFGEWMHKVYWACRSSGFDGETVAEMGRLEYILIDILAKRVWTPFHRFLGIVRDSAAMYGGEGSTHLSGRAPAAEMGRFLECGYRTVKMKVGTEFETRLDYDMGQVKPVRVTAGPGVSLAIDGSHVLPPRGARWFADRVEAHNITWLEEPIHTCDFAGYCELARDLPIIVATGESARDHYLFRPYLEIGVRHFRPTPSAFSEVREWTMVRNMAADNGLDFSSGGLPLFVCPLVATAGEDIMEEFLEVCNQPVLDCMEVTIKDRDGGFHIPNLPGLPFCSDTEWLGWGGFLLPYTFYKAF